MTIFKLTRIVLTWLNLTWLYLTWSDLTWLDLTWLDLTWLVLTWLDLTWLDLIWIDLTLPGFSRLDLTWLLYHTLCKSELGNISLSIWTAMSCLSKWLTWERESREKMQVSANPNSPELGLELGREGLGLGCALYKSILRDLLMRMTRKLSNLFHFLSKNSLPFTCENSTISWHLPFF